MHPLTKVRPAASWDFGGRFASLLRRRAEQVEGESLLCISLSAVSKNAPLKTAFVG